MGEEEEEEEEEEVGSVGGEPVLPDHRPVVGRGESDNPQAGLFDVTVSIPETLEIRMVDATVLSDYEVWSFIGSILGAAVVGFGVAYFQKTSDKTLLAVTLMFVVLFGIAVRMAFVKRKRLNAKSKTIKFRASGSS